MPLSPSGGGSIAPPMLACPSLRMSIKALRSRVSAIARRRSGLSNGGARELTIRLLLTPLGRNSQIAWGSWRSISFNKRHGHLVGNVMSIFPASKAKSAVERLGMIVHSIPSRYGRPGFQ